MSGEPAMTGLRLAIEEAVSEIVTLGQKHIEQAYDAGVKQGEQNARAVSTGRSVGGLKPICAKCRMFYRMHRSGVYFEEGMPIGNGAWQPYKLWCGDLWKCPGCEAEIIAGVGAAPIAEHYQREYKERAEALSPIFRVDDC